MRQATAATGSALVLVALMLSLGRCAAADATYLSKRFTNLGDVSLGAATDRTDYESIDPVAHRLYIAKMGAGKLLLFDLGKNRLLKEWDGFPKVTGVLAVPELHKVYASVPGSGLMASLFVGLGMIGLSSGRGEISVLDTESLKEVARLPGGVFPDSIAYDAKDHRVFVSDELGSELVVLDSNADRSVARVPTGGEVGNVRYDGVTGKVYVPVQSHNELIEIDPSRSTVASRYPIAGCEHPHGFIVAPAGAVGYVACDGNDRLVTIELSTGHVLKAQQVAHDPDVLAIDESLHRLYVAGESGILSTFAISTASSPIALGDVFVGDDAHSVAVDPVTHRLYFALANIEGKCVLREVAPKAQ